MKVNVYLFSVQCYATEFYCIAKILWVYSRTVCFCALMVQNGNMYGRKMGLF
jgi:hypothetical protein